MTLMNSARSMGTRPRINHTIVKLRVLEDANPGLLSRVKTVCFMADYVLYSLGGEHVTDYSVASTTGALDMQKQCWNESLWQWAGLSVGVLPCLVSPGTCVGTISAAAARELGIDEGAKLVIGGLDHVPSSIGCGVTQKGQMMDAIGTVDCYFLVTDTIDPAPVRRRLPVSAALHRKLLRRADRQHGRRRAFEVVPRASG